MTFPDGAYGAGAVPPGAPHGAPPGPSFEMSFDGAPVPARPGQSVGAVLVAHGITSWRTTRRGGRPRGLFCGIGVCYDCLIMVDGRPGERACVVPARAGMELRSEPPPLS
ncbi:(2Fe-2S)-binding protein [Streptomyces sp. 7-21]|uniref:(2Fe-2S)-binding protein n=1 Tax=Streptomyces sp. 7-21 TaxID=2802283 RepID=UPI00192018C9|nr:(2Fe-2S)-binding protein [Streptomyces sp. 7-21]MBL1066407.1 (2Fe-2S)-binding protein [Streptomyces sp. 7-21]